MVPWGQFPSTCAANHTYVWHAHAQNAFADPHKGQLMQLTLVYSQYTDSWLILQAIQHISPKFILKYHVSTYILDHHGRYIITKEVRIHPEAYITKFITIFYCRQSLLHILTLDDRSTRSTTGPETYILLFVHIPV